LRTSLTIQNTDFGADFAEDRSKIGTNLDFSTILLHGFGAAGAAD
jgi:hypothetical protein